MPFELPSFDEMRTLMLASWSGRFPNAALSRHHQNYKLVSVFALGVVDNHYHIRQVGLDLMVDTAEGEMLRRHGKIWGVEAKGASGSTASDALRVVGDVGATVPVNEALVHPASGLRFETRSGGTIPAGGFLDVDIAALDTGAVTNLEVGEELQWETTPTGLESSARIVVELENGQDNELEDAHRTRLLNRLQQPATGGNRNDYEQWVLESAAYVDYGYVYPNRYGLGTVDVAALKSGSGSARLLDAGDRDTVLDYLDVKRPVSATVRVLEVIAAEVDVEVTIVPESDPAYVFDWDDSTPPTVSSYNAGTRTLTLSAARPVGMTVGDRIIIRNAASDGRQWVIESLSSTDAVVLTEALDFTPSASDPVYSGGPLVTPVRDAIIALIDGLGPANPDDSRYGPWEGNLRRSALFEVVQTTAGVLDSTVVAPASNVEAEDLPYPGDGQIELLVPGQILVRQAH